MSIRNSRPGNLTITLVIYVALFLALSVCSDAKDVHFQRRDHGNLKRLIKRRSFLLVPVIDAGSASPISASASTTTSDSSSTSTTQSTTSATSLASETSTSSSMSSLTSTTVSSSSSTTSTSTSATSIRSTTFSSFTSQPLGVSSAVDTVSTPAPKSTVTQIESVSSVSSSSSSSIPSTQSGASKTKSTTLMVVIIIASCVAGITILWTVFRKWKFGRSSKFDERLQPIDWDPTNAEDAGQRRSSTGASSFQSGAVHGGNPTGGGGGGYGSDHGHSYGLPDHDFTAGPAILAPVGGYADLARGPSPQPPMHQLTRGPSSHRPVYDVGVPLHHQAGYSAEGGSRF